MLKKKKMYSPELFQGENFKNGYFEGWYFKHSTKEACISFIAGISLEKDHPHAFIQIISNTFSKYIKYDASEFSYSNNPFFIKVGDNYFSKENIILNIDRQDIKVFGEVKYSNLISINKSKYSPNIMGPFAYCNFLECYHGVISLYHNINGSFKVSMKTPTPSDEASCGQLPLQNKEITYNFLNDVRIYRKRLG